MYTTQLYLPDEIHKKVSALAKTQGKSKAEVLRQLIIEGLKRVKTSSSPSVKVLLKLADVGGKGPPDLAEKHDAYTWD